MTELFAKGTGKFLVIEIQIDRDQPVGKLKEELAEFEIQAYSLMDTMVHKDVVYDSFSKTEFVRYVGFARTERIETFDEGMNFLSYYLDARRSLTEGCQFYLKKSP